MTLSLIRRLLILLLSSFLFGCDVLDPLPLAARPGDTVAIALSDIDDGTGWLSGSTWMGVEAYEYIRKADLSITLTDDLGVAHAIQPRSVFRLYADPISPWGSDRGDAPNGNAFDGQWALIFDLPMQIASGTGTISIVHSNPNFSFANRLIEILSTPSGMSNPFTSTFDDFFSPVPAGLPNLEAPKHIVFRVSRDAGLVEISDVAGMSVQLRMDQTMFDARPFATKPNGDPGISVTAAVEADGSDYLMRVLVLNPHGFSTDDESEINHPTGLPDQNHRTSAWKNLSFALALGFLIGPNVDPITQATWPTHLQVDSAEFFDTAGNPVSGLSLEEIPLFY